MTISSTTTRAQYSGNGATTAFAVPFEFLSAAGVKVIYTDADGVDATWVKDTHYTLTDNTAAATGTVNVKTTPTDYTPASGTKITILRNEPLTQPQSYTVGDPFPAKSHEKALDRLAMKIQMLEERLDRVATLKETSTYSDLTFPEPYAGKIVGWNAGGTALENKTDTDLGVNVFPASASRYIRNNASGIPDVLSAADSTRLDAVAAAGIGTTSGTLKTLNADGGFTLETTETTQYNQVNDFFGFDWNASHRFHLYSEDPFTTFNRTTVAISHEAVGCGLNGPGSADSALWVTVSKEDLDSTEVGEIDALRVTTFNNALSDCSGMLISAYKKIGDGAADEGSASIFEGSVRRFTTDLNTYDHMHTVLAGFSPNPTSVWNARATIGLYSENHIGTGFAHFLGIDDGATAGAATTQYLLAGYTDRLSTAGYFYIEGETGNIESIWNDAGATGGEWRRTKKSASPAANDILWNEYWRGRNSALEYVDYARMYAYIVDPTDASEDGALQFRTMVAGTETDQFRISTGVSVGPATGGGIGQGSVNISGAYWINGNAVVTTDRHLRLRTYTVATLPTATAQLMIYVSDGTSNKRLAVADGTNWRFPDGAIVS